MIYHTKYPLPTAAERSERQAAALELTTGARSGTPPLTDRERVLLDTLKRLGYEIGSTDRFPRYIGRAA